MAVLFHLPSYAVIHPLLEHLVIRAVKFIFNVCLINQCIVSMIYFFRDNRATLFFFYNQVHVQNFEKFRTYWLFCESEQAKKKKEKWLVKKFPFSLSSLCTCKIFEIYFFLHHQQDKFFFWSNNNISVKNSRIAKKLMCTVQKVYCVVFVVYKIQELPKN